MENEDTIKMPNWSWINEKKPKFQHLHERIFEETYFEKITQKKE